MCKNIVAWQQTVLGSYMRTIYHFLLNPAVYYNYYQKLKTADVRINIIK